MEEFSEAENREWQYRGKKDRNSDWPEKGFVADQTDGNTIITITIPYNRQISSTSTSASASGFYYYSRERN